MRTVLSAVALIVLASAGLPSSGAQAASPHFESRHALISGCKEHAHGKDGEDWLSYRCAGFGHWPLWRLYNEGVRMRIGFGSRENYSGVYAAVRNNKWPVEYRGVAAKRFDPFAAILRVEDADGGKHGRLVIYRLRPDGTSCLIGETHGADENAKARAIADASFAKFTCTEEPFMP